MSKLNIVIYPDPCLRVVCEPVKQIDEDTVKLLDDMVETMYAAQGIGLAAPQVGKLIRVIVVGANEESLEQQASPHIYRMINPVIVEQEGLQDGEEGCLSIPNIRESVRRSAKVLVRGIDEKEREVEVEASGLLAVCFQHEIDHLNGVLFIDHLSRLKRKLLAAKLSRVSGK